MQNMEINEALKIIEDFNKYVNSGHKDVIKNYSRKMITAAMAKAHFSQRETLWYKAMQGRVAEIEKKNKKMLILTAVLSVSFAVLCLINFLLYSLLKSRYN